MPIRVLNAGSQAPALAVIHKCISESSYRQGCRLTAWADILLLGNCSCITLLHAIHGVNAKSALTARDGGNAARLPGAIAAPTSLWVMQEVGRKPLLRFLHSPHPCGLATQEQLPNPAPCTVTWRFYRYLSNRKFHLPVPGFRHPCQNDGISQDVGRNKTARRQPGRVFPAIGVPETPVLRLTRGLAYSGLRRDVYNDVRNAWERGK